MKYVYIWCIWTYGFLLDLNSWHQLIQVHQNATPRSNPCRHDGFLGDSLNFPQPLKHRKVPFFWGTWIAGFGGFKLMEINIPTAVFQEFNKGSKRKEWNDFPCGNSWTPRKTGTIAPVRQRFSEIPWPSEAVWAEGRIWKCCSWPTWKKIEIKNKTL